MRKPALAIFLLSLFFLIAANISTKAQGVGIMTTWIGDSITGYTGDGGPANLAKINYPNDVCFDAAHNLYFTDQGNNVIRKVSASTGIISTIAGIGIDGYAGDGGQAINATLRTPYYLCIDNAGNIYFSDDNDVIRKITATTGIITTIAGDTTQGYSGDGGPATNASLYMPRGICVDASDNIYFADQGNNVIRKVTAATGIITTIAGNGTNPYTINGVPATSAMLGNPSCVCVDAFSNIYIADEWDEVIRKITATTGIINTIAGNGTNTFSGDGGPATDAAIAQIDGIFVDGHGDVYIDDWSCSCRKISAATGIINTVAGNGFVEGYNGDGGCDTFELLNNPAGLYVDPSNGDVIIADYLNNRIRKATQPGYIPTVNGVSTITTISQIDIFPNPSSGKFTIQTKTLQKNTNVEIYNLLGDVIYTTSLTSNLNDIDISSQPTGMYFVNINSSEGRETYKINIIK